MIKNILVCLNNTTDDTIQAAAKLAVEKNACLTGLYIMIDSLNRYYAYEGLSSELMQQILAEENDHAAQAEKQFKQIARKIGCNARWQSISENEEPLHALFYADLIVTHYSNEKKGLRFSDSGFSGSGFINRLLLETSQPIVIIPDGWSEDSFGQNISLAWNESRESSRAMHAALALMQQAEQVSVVMVNCDKESKGHDVSTYLASHNINCTLYGEQTDEDTPEIGEVILANADENDSDLIVMGGYGHSHFREVFLGGVTRYLIHNSNIPLLLVH